MFTASAALSGLGGVRTHVPNPASKAFAEPQAESDPPDLSDGLLFLGSAVMVAGHVIYGPPPPPPIRPNVKVQVVPTGPVLTPGGTRVVPVPECPIYLQDAYVVLYFG